MNILFRFDFGFDFDWIGLMWIFQCRSRINIRRL